MPDNKMMTCLWFDTNAEEAVDFYCSVFKNAKKGSVSYYGDAGPMPKGQVMMVTFSLNGQEFFALNGGPVFKFTPAISLVAICEDLPEEHNTVTLDPVLKDTSGIPAPRIDYTLSENSRRMMEHAVARGTEVLQAAGARDVGFELPITEGGWHLMGTARMGTDPARSVVNEWGRSHDVKNLFIVDGSVFVTSAGVNPTRTIQALALYIADTMKQRLATLFD